MKEGINKEVIIKSKIDKKKLNKYQYTNSLIEYAIKLKLFDMKDLINIQNQLANYLVELIMLETKGESTSLTVDKTKDLTNSMIYTLDIYLESFLNPDDGVYELKTQKISGLMQKGIHIIENMYNEVMDLYVYAVKNKLKVPLECYHTTIDEGIPIFLKHYNIIFSAHITVASIDYPIAIDDWNICGIKYINTYLKRFILETNFCKIFGNEKIEKLLYCFGEKINVDYKLELINIFELTYNNAIFMVLNGCKATDLILTSYNSKVLIQRMKKLSSSEIETMIKTATKKLLMELNIKDEETIEYMYQYMPKLVQRLNINKKNQSLDSILVSEVEEKSKEKFYIFKSSEGMDGKNFRKIVNAIGNIYSDEEKADYIVSNITSIYDFIDILNSEYLYDKEYEALFSKLNDFELTILIKFIYYEDMRDRSETIYEIISKYMVYDYEWQVVFNEYLKNLNQDRLNNIEKYIDKIDYKKLSFD